LLAQAKPKSFISGALVDLGVVLQSCNRTEFHHVFPKNHLAEILKITERDRQYALADFAFLSQKDNRSIKDKAPADYEKLIPAGDKIKVLAAAYIPATGLTGTYDDFVTARADLLAAAANQLCV
jgi:hypothetical protein